MAYQPRSRKNDGYKENPKGTARVKYKKGKLLVWFEDIEENGEFADKKYVVRSWPDHVDPKTLSGTWYVNLSGKNSDELFGISPLVGMYTGKVFRFASPDGQPPVPKQKKYIYNGKEISYQYFTVLIEVVDGDRPEAKGMLIPYVLRYNFGLVEDKDDEEYGMVEYTFDGSKAVYTPKLREFLHLVGTWDKGPIKHEDNILPTLQKRILKAGKTFKFIVKDGWIDNIYEDFAAGAIEDDWDEEKPKKKKKKSKKSKKEEVPFELDEEEEEEADLDDWD